MSWEGAKGTGLEKRKYENGSVVLMIELEVHGLKRSEEIGLWHGNIGTTEVHGA